MEKNETLTGFAIVVADRGFVYVGNATIDEKWCILTGAKNIRVWGTTAGLGQLALDGTQEKTRLDDCGTVRIPMRAVISVIDTESAKWNCN